MDIIVINTAVVKMEEEAVVRIGIDGEALVRICLLTDAMYTLWTRSTRQLVDVLDTLGVNAQDRIGWSSNGRHELRRYIADGVAGRYVAQRDRFWTDLEEKKEAALDLPPLFNVETQVVSYGFEGTLSEMSSQLAWALEIQGVPMQGPVRYAGLTRSVEEKTRVLQGRSDRCLSANRDGNAVLRETVLLIVEVFDQVHELFKVVVPFMRDELMEAVDHGGRVSYKLRENGANRGVDLADRMEGLMLQKIRDIAFFLELELGRGR